MDHSSARRPRRSWDSRRLRIQASPAPDERPGARLTSTRRRWRRVGGIRIRLGDVAGGGAGMVLVGGGELSTVSTLGAKAG